MTYEFSWLLFLSFYYYYYYLWMWLLNSLLCLVCTGNVDTSQYEVQFPTVDPVHFLPFISHDFLFFLFFFLSHLLSFDSSRTIFQQMPAVFFFSFPFFSSLITSITGSGSSISLLLSPQAIYPVVFFPSPFLLYTLLVLSDQTQIPLYPPPNPCHHWHRTQDGPEGKWDWYKKEPT